MRDLLEREGMADAFMIDSAGTGAWHVGERADARSRATAKARGVALESRARQFMAEDFSRFDYVVAMDRSNRRALLDLAGEDAGAHGKVLLLRELTGDVELDVPDPYYEDNFDHVFDVCEAGCRALLAHVRGQRGA